MIRFDCDYTEGAHPKILERLSKFNFEQNPGYSNDYHCETARKLIKEACKRPDADVHFLVGGTQTNTTVAAAALRSHQGIICPSSGHIGVHESGAIESTGHKVLSIPAENGKITAEQIMSFCDSHFNDATHEHAVQPAMVYISFSTEVGTIYSKAELTAISDVCKKCGLILYIDGARLGYGLMSDICDVTLADIAALADVFYIGGTKQGMLCGEALVINNDALKKDFRYIIKQHGGLFAKGWIIGIEYSVMFEDFLYFDLAKNADKLAMKIKKAFEDSGYKMYFDSYTNQQFPILPNDKLEILNKNFVSDFWCKIDETHTAVRFCTSWATSEENADKLIMAIKSL